MREGSERLVVRPFPKLPKWIVEGSLLQGAGNAKNQRKRPKGKRVTGVRW